ncbi:MAG: inositol monophosphatase family protein [Bacillota bacterium]
MHDTIKATLVEAVTAGGAIMRERVGQVTVQYKASWSDLVTEVDRAVEESIFAQIRARFPDHGVLGEEGGGSFAREYTWILDPLDGTTNFAHTLPNFVCSLACCHGTELLAGAVYDPSRDELFVAVRGEGATLNGRPVRVDHAATLKESLVSTNLLWDMREDRFYALPGLQDLGRQVRGVRSLGAAALELAYVACGRLSGFAQFKLAPWDYAAGALLVQEAGGQVSRFDGSPLDMTLPSTVVASNGQIHAAMLEHLRVKPA